MSFYSNLTEQDLINLGKLAEKQKEQRAIKNKNILKQTHDIKLAESLSPITKKLKGNKESTLEVGKVIKKSDIQDGNTQTPAIENTSISQSLRDTSSFMETSKKVFKLEQTDKDEVFWNKIPIKALGDNRISTDNQEFDITPAIQKYITSTKEITKTMDNEDKLTVFNKLKDTDCFL